MRVGDRLETASTIERGKRQWGNDENGHAWVKKWEDTLIYRGRRQKLTDEIDVVSGYRNCIEDLMLERSRLHALRTIAFILGRGLLEISL